MHLTALDLLEALLAAVVAGVATWLALTPVRRTLPGLLASLVLTGAAASMGALWGAIHSMLIASMWRWPTVLAVTAFIAVVLAVAAFAVGRHLVAGQNALRAAVDELGAGRPPSSARGRRGRRGVRPTVAVEQLQAKLEQTGAALLATQERERALERSRRELVAWMSHDLRTPLAGLRAMTEALEDGVADDPGVYYKQIAGAVDQLTHMVEELFALSRVQAGLVASRVDETVSLVDLASDCVAGLLPLADARGVHLRGDVSGADRQVAVRGNGADLNRALTNLVANAIRFTPSGGRVEVRVAAVDGAAEVVVLDACGGIAPELLTRVFDVGFRGQPARTPAAEPDGRTGAGLGLAITRGIVEALDGAVDARNTANGCRFRIRLPLAADATLD